MKTHRECTVEPKSDTSGLLDPLVRRDPLSMSALESEALNGKYQTRPSSDAGFARLCKIRSR